MKDDVEEYIERRKRANQAFAKDFDAGYEEFKVGVMLRQAREEAGVTQERNLGSAKRGRLDITPKWVDIQTCIITCSV